MRKRDLIRGFKTVELRSYERDEKGRFATTGRVPRKGGKRGKRGKILRAALVAAAVIAGVSAAQKKESAGATEVFKGPVPSGAKWAKPGLPAPKLRLGNGKPPTIRDHLRGQKKPNKAVVFKKPSGQKRLPAPDESRSVLYGNWPPPGVRGTVIEANPKRKFIPGKRSAGTWKQLRP